MRLLFVVQRYGEEVAGGAEQHCREFAERLVTRGHDVDVVTTCASSYVDWANVYPPGRSDLNGVHVHRLPTALPRNPHLFNSLNARVLTGKRPRPLELQREWMRMQGPFTPELPQWLIRRSHAYDCVVFITYLYWTAWAGLRAVAGSIPTMLHPTAHDEPPMRLSIFDEVMRLPDALAFLTPEERELVERRFPGAPDGDVIGIGVDLDTDADARTFRDALQLGDAPYLCYVGRVDPAKGASELIDYFCEYKRRHRDDLQLVFVGEPLIELPARDDLRVTGFVDRKVRDDAMSGALAVAHPSYFESFSMVLTEAFAVARPMLVQRDSVVMYGHAQRSNGAIAYRGFGEFEVAVEMLMSDPGMADTLGRNGRAYVERAYQWDTVLSRYEDLIRATVEEHRARATRSTA
jgi:glycosyltransferase involved in cell wall biosynthesis